MRHCWNENQHFQNWGITSFEKSCLMFSASWRYTIAAGGEIPSILGSHSRVMEGKTKNWMFDQESKCCNASFAPFSRLKRELLRKAKLSVFKSLFVPMLTYGHKSWVMTKKVQSQMQASEMRFMRKIEGVTMFDKHRSTAIRESSDFESLLLRIERSLLRWFDHVSRMLHERLPK